MTHYVKNLYSFDPDLSFNKMPDFIGQREEITCPICHQRIRIAVPATGIDWERVANDYRRYAETLNVKVYELGKKIQQEFGQDFGAEIQYRELLDLVRKLKQTLGEEPLS